MLDSLLYFVVVIGFQNLETWEKSIIFWLYFREGETFRSMDRLEAELTFWTQMTVHILFWNSWAESYLDQS